MLIDPRSQDHEIRAHALASVGRVRAHLMGVEAGVLSPERARVSTVQEWRGVLAHIARSNAARPVDDDKPLSGVIARMIDPQWWRKNLRRELLRQNENIEHAQGRVRRRGMVYVSDHAVHVKKSRAKENRRTLEALEVVNEFGQAFNLQDVADKSVSNPKLRRAELMMRCRGFEETAKYMQHEAVFITLTCPSRFHRFDAQGKPNAKWTGATPRAGQDYLNKVWKKIRADWSRAGYTPYGFRVAEPHHDGCPHWHILLFAPPETIGWFVPHRFVADRDDFGAGLLGMAGRQAMADSGGERGAVKHRFTVKHIDPQQGSATGYIAKYICKNIDGMQEDGQGMGLDFASGKNAVEASERVRVWASTHGIRQFQQIGGPSVTVWRELRRLGKDLDQPLQLPLFEMPRAAADRALWSLFWVLQGGPEVRRSELTLRPLYVKDGRGKYGDDTPSVWGVEGIEDGQSHELQTRLHEWTVQAAGTADQTERQAEHSQWLQTRRNVNKFLTAAGEPSRGEVRDFEAVGEAVRPWTGVNNCTAGEHRYFGNDASNAQEVKFAEADFDSLNNRVNLRGFGGQHQGKPPHDPPNSGPFSPGIRPH